MCGTHAASDGFVLTQFAAMAELDKRYNGAPFGTQTPRFDIAGVHPASKTPASFTQVFSSLINLVVIASSKLVTLPYDLQLTQTFLPLKFKK